MLKSIGALHNVPAPSAAVLGESLKLLATFGDKKDIGKLLEQMREVQEKNEQVFRDAQAAIGEITAKRQELEDNRSAFASSREKEAAALGYRAQELSQAEARLSGRVAKFDDEREASLLSLEGNRIDLANREADIAERELKCLEKEQDVLKRVATITRKESALSAKEQQLQAKEQKLRAALE